MKDNEEEERRRRNRFEEPISMIKTMPEPRRGSQLGPYAGREKCLEEELRETVPGFVATRLLDSYA